MDMKGGGTYTTSSIEWHDSPKLIFNRSGSLRSKAPELKTLDSEEQFNAEFDRWFCEGFEDDDETTSAADNDNGDLTPPILRIHHDLGIRDYSKADSPKTPSSETPNNDSKPDDRVDLIESLKRAKQTIEKIIEERRRRTISPEQHSSSAKSEHPKAVLCDDRSIILAKCKTINTNQRSTYADKEGPCTSTQLIIPTKSSGMTRGMIQFGCNTLQQPSPITPVESRKRKRILSSQRRSLLANGQNSIVAHVPSFSSSSSLSSDDSDEEGRHIRDQPLESTPLSSSRNNNNFGVKKPARGILSPFHNPSAQEDASGYDSMDDESINLMLSQIPIPVEPVTSNAKQHTSTNNMNKFTKQPAVVSKPPNKMNKVENVQNPLNRSSNDRTPLRRCKTGETLPPVKHIRIGGWSQRISAIKESKNSVISNDNRVTEMSGQNVMESELTMPRSVSFEPPKTDSFWDDDDNDLDEFDFKAIDEAK